MKTTNAATAALDQAEKELNRLTAGTPGISCIGRGNNSLYVYLENAKAGKGIPSLIGTIPVLKKVTGVVRPLAASV